MPGLATRQRHIVRTLAALSVVIAPLVSTLLAQSPRTQALDTPTMTYTPSASKVLMDVRIDDNVHATMVAHVSITGGIFLPFQRLMTLAGIRITSRFGILSTPGRDSRPGFVLHHDRRTITIGKLNVPLLPGDLFEDGSTLMISTELASRLLDVAIDADVMGAMIVLRDASQLPSARRQLAISQARRNGVLAQEQSQALVPLLANTYRASIQGDYDLFVSRTSRIPGVNTGTSTTSLSGSEWTAYLQARVAGRVAGGNLAGRVSSSRASGYVRDVQWTKYRPASTRLSHVVIGALDAGGLTGSRVQGISIDNQPVDYSQRRMVRVRGRAEEGWDYTLRQGSGWTGDERPGDGSYEFKLPMIGDVARVDVIGWGPDGQERRFVRSVHAVPMRVQRGEWQYSTAAGRCAAQSGSAYSSGNTMVGCRWFAGADTRVGLTDWLVARTGIDAVPGAIAPYVGGAAVIAGTLTLQASHTVASGRTRHGAFSAQFEPSPALSASLARSTSLTGQTTQFASVHVAPSRWDGRLGVDGWLSQSSGEGVPNEIGRIGVLGMAHGIRMEVFGSRTIIGMATTGSTNTGFRGNAVGVEATAAPSWLRIPRVQRAWVAGGVERSVNGVIRNTLRVDASLPRAFVEISRAFSNTREAGRWAITVTPRSRTARQSTTYARTGGGNGFDGGTSLMHTISGNATWEAQSRGLMLSSDQATNRGTIVGHTFLDVNDNNRFDTGEPLVGDVPVVVSNRALRSDSIGRFRAEHMTVTELIDVAIDSLALPSPCWRAGAPRWRVRVAEGGVIDVRLPIRRGGILEGRITRGSRATGSATPVNVAWDEQPTLLATSVTSGETFAIDVFGAGTFYLMGIPFGDYTISMPESDQRRLGVTVPPVRTTINAAHAGASADASAAACPVTSAIVRAIESIVDSSAGPTRTWATDWLSVESTTAPRGHGDSTAALIDIGEQNHRTSSNGAASPQRVARVREYARKSRRLRAARALTHRDTLNLARWLTRGTHGRAAALALESRQGLVRRLMPICDPAAGRFNLNSGNFTLLGCQTDAWRRENPDGIPVERPHL